MIRAIILTFIILVVIYIFLFRSTKRRKHSDFDTVSEYRELYVDRKSLNQYKNSSADNSSRRVRSYSAFSGDSGSTGTTRYITKYNSSEDYREK